MCDVTHNMTHTVTHDVTYTVMHSRELVGVGCESTFERLAVPEQVASKVRWGLYQHDSHV